MHAWDLTLLTESRHVAPAETDWYVDNILAEDALLKAALERHGLRVTRVGWDDPDFDWSSTRTALFRATWDYFHRFDEFSAWLERVGAQTTLINPARQARWNLDKHYLADLGARGVRVTDTRFIEAGSDTTLVAEVAASGWDELILKPAVSGAARHTYRFSASECASLEAVFADLVAHEALLLQPFQHNILEQGEYSFMVFGGRYTHAVLKVAKPGDFRVQDDFGGSVHVHEATPAQIEFAEAAVAACDPLPAYARVDAFVDNDGQLAVGELELVEPELWFRLHPPAADALAVHVAERWFGAAK
ncbi:MAG: hypothetical protein R3233_03635 [Xanthomonadales bacterium]|nr:hypothetical protein [Xanthomonadales bacterium]